MLNLDLPEVKFALHAVRQACALVEQIQAEQAPSALTKDDRSPVTIADFAVQALVAHLLEQAFPQERLVGEEDVRLLQPANTNEQGAADEILETITAYVRRFLPQATPQSVLGWIERGSASPNQRFWTLDPLDGTKGFLRGDQYAIALALIVGGEVQLGVLGCPKLNPAARPDNEGHGALVVAVRRQGAWITSLEGALNFQRLRVSACANPAQARLLRSFESGHTHVSQVEALAQVLGIQTQPVRMDSQAKYALLAAGQGELLVRLLSPSKPHYREKIWDQAAGALIVEEAGGMITDLDGKPLDFSQGRTLARNRGILASNGHLHAVAIQALRTLGA